MFLLLAEYPFSIICPNYECKVKLLHGEFANWNIQYSTITALWKIYASNTHRYPENRTVIIGAKIVDSFPMQKLCTIATYTTAKRMMSQYDRLACIPQCSKDQCWLLPYLLLTDRHFGTILFSPAYRQHTTPFTIFPSLAKVSQAFVLEARFKKKNYW